MGAEGIDAGIPYHLDVTHPTGSPGRDRLVPAVERGAVAIFAPLTMRLYNAER